MKPIEFHNESELLQRLLDLLKDAPVETICECLETAAKMQGMTVEAIPTEEGFAITYGNGAEKFERLSGDWDSNLT
jgi:hypothetical protein